MVRRIILVLALVVVIALSIVGYNDWKLKHAMMSGDVASGPASPTDEDSSPRSAPPPPPANSAPSQPIAYPPSGSVAASWQSLEASQTATPPRASQTSGQAVAPAITQLPPPPTSDTIAPNPPNGLTFAGSGRYQVYRQGNITWRLDTDTGRTCALLATNEEWRNPQVYRYGCAYAHIR